VLKTKKQREKNEMSVWQGQAKLLFLGLRFGLVQRGGAASGVFESRGFCSGLGFEQRKRAAGCRSPNRESIATDLCVTSYAGFTWYSLALTVCAYWHVIGSHLL